MKNIVITNFYGFKNIGDAAILESALRILNKSIPNSNYQIHTAIPFSNKFNNDYLVKSYIHPYGIAIKTRDKPISNVKKIYRFLIIVVRSLMYVFIGKLNPDLLPENGDYSYIRSLKNADMVLGVGGGYLRTKSKYKDLFGLILTLLPIYIAHLYNKRILYLPMSFGNFATEFHEKLVFDLIKKDKIVFRDEISSNQFIKHSKKDLDTIIIPDMALFDSYKKNKIKGNKYIVLTARLWLNESKQNAYEKDLADFIDYVWEKYKLKTVFIPMVWNDKEEDDKRVALRIKKLLLNKDMFEIVSVKTTLEVKKIIYDAKFTVCTRMHSAILSTVVKTPFITIAYEYKTVGFLKHLGLEEWNIDMENFSVAKLKKKFDKLQKSSSKFILVLEKKHLSILKKENEIVKIIREFNF